jgi:purine-binding chemotaxis protein CheW
VTGTGQFSTFFVDEFLFGIDIAKVQEVVSGPELTPVPLSPPIVRGLINLRGQIVTAIDLRRCLELSHPSVCQPFVNIIIYTEDGCVSLLADRAGDVLSVDSEEFEYAPPTLEGRLRELIRGAFKLDRRLLLVLDTDKVVEGLDGPIK